MKLRHGFTLAEMLVTIIIFMLILGVVLIDFRRVGEREKFQQAAVDMANSLLDSQSRSLANAVPECTCSSSCDCIPQWYGVAVRNEDTNYERLVAANGNSTLEAMETQTKLLPTNVTVFRVRLGTADVTGSNVALIGFLAPSGRVAVLETIVTPVDFSGFENKPAYVYLQLTTPASALCRLVSVAVNGRVSFDDVSCPA